MAKTVWKNRFIIDVYELAKSGLTEKKIAAILGISIQTFHVWEDKKTIFKMCLDKGRELYKTPSGETANFSTYVYRRLSREDRKTWNKIDRFTTAKGGVEKIEAMLEKGGVRMRQSMFIHAMCASNFSYSAACRRVNISGSTFAAWKKHDPEFATLIQTIEWERDNFLEDHYMKLVKGGNVSATLTGVKSRLRKRGYAEKTEIELSGEVSMGVVNIEDYDLTLEEMKWLLSKHRQSKKNQKPE